MMYNMRESDFNYKLKRENAASHQSSSNKQFAETESDETMETKTS